MGKLKCKIYENKVKLDTISFDDIDDLKKKLKKKWG